MAVLEIILFALGFVLLIKGSDYFVEAAARIARKIGTSDFIIGLTIVAIGTSLPELFTSITASLKQDSSFIIGNVIGSNIANACLILGTGAAISTLAIKKSMITRDSYVMILTSFLVYLFALNLDLSRYEAAFLLLIYFSYLSFLIKYGKDDKKSERFSSYLRYFLTFGYVRVRREILTKVEPGKATEEEVVARRVVFDLLILLISIAALILGAHFIVEEAEWLASTIGITTGIVSLTIVAIGTSLPELSVTVRALRKGYGGMIVGNVIGSNISNLLLILGVAALISPISITKTAIVFLFPMMLLVSLALIIMMRSEWKLKRYEGWILIALYLIFLLITYAIAR